MIRISNIHLPLDYEQNTIMSQVCKTLSLPKDKIKSAKIHKRSVDARKKNDIHFVCSIDVLLINDNITKLPRSAAIVKDNYKYSLPKHEKLSTRPLVVGSGPAGLFAALILAQAGQKPILIERGYDVDKREKAISEFWDNRKLDIESNVQFGEGGAGTFSDGKLNTGIKDSRIQKVLQEFVHSGAPEEILYVAKPHIGTDNLKIVVKNLRKKIESLGGDIRFSSKLINIVSKDSKIQSALVETNKVKYELETQNIILAIGHSARDTFKMLLNLGLQIQPKPFSLGARIEHLQENINKTQYGNFYKHPKLGAADYKLAVHLKNKRGVYTFCMCPGGKVIASSSEKNSIVTNGMSIFSRSDTNSNSAILVGITPNDFSGNDPLEGMYLQQNLERIAFKIGGANYNAPVQRVEDFLKNKKSTFIGEVIPSYKPGYTLSNLWECFPTFISESIKMGIIEMDYKLPGFAHPDAILTGVETRSSSPIRIIRNDSFQSISLSGLYPCGEGAGYAGGIVSAAVDGIKAAESLLINNS